ncbi:4-(cytidine 5'-diphospho)-2-C-methyl-D-erythritol kinase [Actinospica sp. MGRD01-02]|uniref:4-diphosphocytidyl-2-C-methyl-D-erythritol kinase n=1 Tax=Actinospica acidithermotolerans TaxID=2828514 RepID=A0A941EAN4_9ACTN|nr:4-(cytidine 5'-diphospho)-2-C-methyl-D-erythritol kinase [Actinospica acidithermotolerans]MBR7827717.1 4-(cytidine 5'-diphospho)-2-C-methyl-D-erythritol kinase [Actinospica acidithermotolerans]
MSAAEQPPWDEGPFQPEAVTVRVPAKINLSLSVGPLRPDGYHELVTVFHAVSLYDEVIARSARGISLSVEPLRRDSDVEQVPADERNLAWQAAALLAEQCGVEPNVRLTIRKDIPVAGGMAGGSADAAATLVACDSLWGTGLRRDELHDLAAQLGSDVPFALHGGTAIGTGRGEHISPVLAATGLEWVIAVLDAGLSTPKIFEACDNQRRRNKVEAPSPSVHPDLMAALRSRDTAAIGRALYNDLQPASIEVLPEIGELLELGRAAGACGSLVSGSGPTTVFLVDGPLAAANVEAELRTSGRCRAVRRARGPVPGANIVNVR